MAECRYCKMDMGEAAGCTPDAIVINGVEYQPVRYGKERGPRRRPTHRCGDCNVLPGEVHHHGCDLENCPRCGRQSITCGCLWAGEEHLEEGWLEELEERFAQSDVTEPPGTA